jgi:ESCRT-II complex subunit VPS36
MSTSLEADDGTSLALDLAQVVYTESYAGFFKSSPKITLYFASLNDDAGPSRSIAPSPAPTSMNNQITGNPDNKHEQLLTQDADDDWSSWKCTICGNRNPPGLSPAARGTCTLCGMPRDLDSIANGPATLKLPSSPPILIPHASTSSAYAASKSLPSSSSHAPVPNQETSEDDGIACSACTFLNHPSLRECEMCGTPLQRPNTPASSSSRPHSVHASSHPSKSAPVSRPSSPESSEQEGGKATNKYIRLSFRKGGDKSFYASLKTSLQTKAWLVSIT